RWFGACLSAYGICYNKDDDIAAAGEGSAEAPPASWSDLARPERFGRIALADPSKSAAATKAFEMVIQQQMNVRAAALASEGAADVETRAPIDGWVTAMRLIRRIAANARYFTDSGVKVPLDVASGDASAGMCVDFYGRFESEASARGGASHLGFVLPRGGTSIGADPIARLRGAPHPDLAREFLEFVLSVDGQKLWNFKVGTPGGPTRYALRRLPILPALYAPDFAKLRSDPNDDPYRDAASFTYHPAWTGALFRAISFVVRVSCVDTEDELATAYRELIRSHFPPRATALFDDVSIIDYPTVSKKIRATLTSPNPLDEAVLASELVRRHRDQYREVARLAQEGL
ncbi:MAG TPA: extracellular solute-binding protein, partial [Polyangiaceae bacterium]|nr:extracellular solute-binding protein [Polyangiaceae bacterium]